METQTGGSRVILSTPMPACCRHPDFSKKHLDTSSQSKAANKSSKQTNLQGQTVSVPQEIHLSGPLQDHQQAHWFPVEVWKWITNTRRWSIHFCGVIVPCLLQQQNKHPPPLPWRGPFLSAGFILLFVLYLECRSSRSLRDKPERRQRPGKQPADLVSCWHDTW